jgi:plastocyanin
MRTRLRLAIVTAVSGASLAAPAVLHAQDSAAPADQPPATTATGTTTTTTPAPDPPPVVGAPGVSVSSGYRETKASSGTMEVTMKGSGHYKFVPRTLKISTGDTVTWTNRSNASHDATEKNNGDSWTPTLNKGDHASHTFDKAGTFQYYCSFHPYMKATIEVKGSSSGGGGGGSNGGSGGNSGSGSGSGGIPSTTSAPSSPTIPYGSESGAGSSPTSAGSSSTLPKTGLPVLPLLAAALGLLAIGGLIRWAATALYYRGW